MKLRSTLQKAALISLQKKKIKKYQSWAFSLYLI